VATLLVAERTLLNLLQRLSGVATMTRRFVRTIGNAKARLLDTRKTTPGLRDLEKYAVRTGGGVNHRFGLYDMVMLKDNHITAMGGDIRSAVEQARKRHGPSLKIEVETATLDQVKEAVTAAADLIMLDNMPPAKLRECVAFVAGRIPLEASGGITLETIAEVAATGVDYISVGAVTHSAPALDLSMKIALED
jgi:nicotinate-nucleotide pyrophosphorylase (carboxylating)